MNYEKELDFSKLIALSIFLFGISVNLVGSIIGYITNNTLCFIVSNISVVYNIGIFVFCLLSKKYNLYTFLAVNFTTLVLLPTIFYTSSFPQRSMMYDFMIAPLYAMCIRKNKDYILPIINLVEIDVLFLQKNIEIPSIIVFSAIYFFQIFLFGYFVRKIFLQFKELKHSEDFFRDVARKDYLTGIYNSYGLFEKINYEKKCFAIMVDIDFFKKVNDYYGHDEGDRILVNLAKILKMFSSKDFLVSRKGGEEFLLISYLSYEETFVNIFNIVTKIHENLISCGGDKITVSIGVSYLDFYSDKLIKDADENLYLAKENGRNKVFYLHKMARLCVDWVF